MVDAGYWTWAHPSPGLPGIDTVPLTNLAGWLVAGVVLMTLLDLLVRAHGDSPRRRRRRAAARARLDDPRRRPRPRRLAGAARLGRVGRRPGRRRPGRARRPARAAAVSGRFLRALAGISVAGAAHAALNAALLRRPPAAPAPVRGPVTVVVPVRDEAARRPRLPRRGPRPARGPRAARRRRGRRLDRRHRRARGRPHRRARGAGDRARARARLAGQAERVRAGRGSRGRRRRPGVPRRRRAADARRVAAAVAVLDGAGLDLVSPWPRQLAGSAAERLVQPLQQWLWATFLPLRLAERSPRPSLAAANGQFLVSCAARPTSGPAGTPRSAARSSRTSPCCARSSGRRARGRDRRVAAGRVPHVRGLVRRPRRLREVALVRGRGLAGRRAGRRRRADRGLGAARGSRRCGARGPGWSGTRRGGRPGRRAPPRPAGGCGRTRWPIRCRCWPWTS